MLRASRQLRGTPYRWGGTRPSSGLDCSGYTKFVYRKALGYRLPRTSRDQARVGHRTRHPRKGDLVFFYNGSGRVFHVGVYAGRRHGKRMMWHSPHSGSHVKLAPIWTTRVFYVRVVNGKPYKDFIRGHRA